MNFGRFFLFISLTAFAVSFCFSAYANARSEYKQAAERYHLLFKNEEKQKFLHNWENVIGRFEAIVKKYPKSQSAQKSLYNIGALYQGLYRWNPSKNYIFKSIQSYRKLTENFPGSYLSDDARFKIAENYELYLNDKNLAVIEYQELMRNYPKSEFAKKAEKRVKRLGHLDDDMNITANSVGSKVNNENFGGLNELEAENSPKVIITGVKHYSTLEWTRIVINSSTEGRYKYNTLEADAKNRLDKRVYVDILNSELGKNFKKKAVKNDGIIKDLRVGQFDKTTVRIVIDLASFSKIEVFNHALPRQNKIIVDIFGEKQTKNWGFALREKSDQAKKENKEQKSQKKIEIPPKTNPAVSLSEALGLKVKTVILDAGHGGRDSGAVGFNIKEKNVALDIVLKLKKLINRKYPELNVFLTRKTDQFISLEKRTAFANKNQGDIFISVHVNASESRRLYGIETYFLNLTNDSQSLRLAAKENQSSLKSISDLQSIINDLLTSTKVQESSQLAAMVQKSVYSKARKFYKTRNLGVKKAPFVVLIGSEMPSILVEVGFISHKRENSWLRNEKYINYLAQGILDGIKSYIGRVSNDFVAVGN